MRVQLPVIPVMIVISCLAGAGCAGNGIVVRDFPESANARQELTALEASLQKASDRDVDYLAAVNYGKAKEALEKAKEGISERESNGEILEKVAEGGAWLHVAEERADFVRGELKQVRDARANAIEADAGTLVPSSLDQVDTRLLDMARTLEAGDTVENSTVEKARLAEDYRKLEIAAVRKARLPALLSVFATAKKEGALRWAPKSLNRTKTEIIELDRLIHQSPESKDRIEAASLRAEQQAAKLMRVIQVRQVSSGASSEEEVLHAERVSRIEAAFAPGEAMVLGSEGAVTIRLTSLFMPGQAEILPGRTDLLAKISELLVELAPESSIRIEAVSWEQALALKSSLAQIREQFPAEIAIARKDSTVPFAQSVDIVLQSREG